MRLASKAANVKRNEFLQRSSRSAPRSLPYGIDEQKLKRRLADMPVHEAHTDAKHKRDDTGIHQRETGKNRASVQISVSRCSFRRRQSALARA